MQTIAIKRHNSGPAAAATARVQVSKSDQEFTQNHSCEPKQQKEALHTRNLLQNPNATAGHTGCLGGSPGTASDVCRAWREQLILMKRRGSGLGFHAYVLSFKDIYIYICINMYVHLCMHEHMYIYIHMYTSFSLCTYMYSYSYLPSYSNSYSYA